MNRLEAFSFMLRHQDEVDYDAMVLQVTACYRLRRGQIVVSTLHAPLWTRRIELPDAEYSVHPRSAHFPIAP